MGLGRYAIDARKWFKGPVINLPQDKAEQIELEKDRTLSLDDIEVGSHEKDSQTTSKANQKKHDSKVEVAQIEKTE
ncbi:hypothetical protein G6F68_021800 [Rhizopus microsporus]|nr:hypothetical protein G6F68_021800 [Rhizopus microsporus]